MPAPRPTSVNDAVTHWYHCNSRRIRRAFPRGPGCEHDKHWIDNRLEELVGVLIAVSLAAGLVAVSTAPNHAQEWRAAQSPLMTRWAKDVSTTNVLPEYPRPQLVRAEWLNLNGVWQFQPGAEGDAPPAGRTLFGTLLVPFPVE
jgi:hypothetical protein